mmetsp:Transcript_64286/g.76097  ORF Transcript_64286/g.76097 Transcript_64286/m.76097 type:complete len:155 (+) Transcript_64286:289-753(+)
MMAKIVASSSDKEESEKQKEEAQEANHLRNQMSHLKMKLQESLQKQVELEKKFHQKQKGNDTLKKTLDAKMASLSVLRSDMERLTLGMEEEVQAGNMKVKKLTETLRCRAEESKERDELIKELTDKLQELKHSNSKDANERAEKLTSSYSSLEK